MLVKKKEDYATLYLVCARQWQGAAGLQNTEGMSHPAYVTSSTSYFRAARTVGFRHALSSLAVSLAP
ncbi:hypothetical protein AtDm6_2347 [Acetobacter tropicalis]|uniref:Uncharacterized protein n=2 Tax=Acetobacter tropicalis TaxID=104102 RepID=A0A094ZIN9_9PROT|nr:hypothetical protein AtDm6_2347 [Acetobacter tropicalis]GAA08276.1 hypothetical protein ATPR_1280 [Acetobacter tropicalis NBRC 101654]GEL50553.1 hypothetical protein ATR01nite_16280 [Acetobacter tropicalis]